MKISKINLYQVSLPMKEGSYSWSNQSFEAFDSTVVQIKTDEGIYGVGEICPLGPAYLPAFAEGARAGITTMAPGLIGQDPRHIGAAATASASAATASAAAATLAAARWSGSADALCCRIGAAAAAAAARLTKLNFYSPFLQLYR